MRVGRAHEGYASFFEFRFVKLAGGDMGQKEML
jgi:hypothetical protein